MMTKFAKLIGSNSDAIYLRWRGRKEGPFLPSVIDAKLAANEIGLLHELLDGKRWITIRDFIRLKEAEIQAEHEAREEMRRQKQEEKDRQEREAGEALNRERLELANANEILRTRAITSEIRREVWRRDQGQCAKCASRLNLEYDHIVPFSKGGSNTVRNVELLCESCNRAKSDSIE